MPESIYLSLNLDVEEEGLFGGVYACQTPSISNTAHLARILPLLERGLKPTLFCAYSALADPASRRVLAEMRDRHGAEIGAHLHHWNTPPLAARPDGSHAKEICGISARAVDRGLLAAKMRSLFQIAQDFQGQPVTSFRMGRWDLLKEHWPLLAENGVFCDASVRPLHRLNHSGPNHFSAPADPYIASNAGNGIVEVPLTATPLVRAFQAGPSIPGDVGLKFQRGLKNWGALALLPIYHPLWLMKITTMLHIRRGGRFLSLTWHSSEMMPGGAPHMPDAISVRLFLEKVENYVDWLYGKYKIRPVTMGEIREKFLHTLPCPIPERDCDWTAMPCGEA